MQISVFLGRGVKQQERARNVCVLSHPVMSTLPSYGLEPARLLCPWGSPGKNTGVGSHSLLQAISLTQGLNLDLLHCRQILYGLSHEGRLRARRKPQDHLLFYPIVVVQSLSHVWLFATPWTACSMPVFPVLLYLLELAQTYVPWVSDAIQPSHPLSLPFSSCPQYFSASGSFPVSRFFASGGQSIGASAPASVLPMNIQGWFPLGLPGLIPLLSKGLSRGFSSTTIQKH